MEKHTSYISWFRNYCTVRSSRLQMLFKTGALKNFANFTGKYLCWSLFLIKLPLQLYQKQTPTQTFFCEIFKNTFFVKSTSGGCFYTVGATFQNTVVWNGKKYNHNKVSYNYLGSPTQADHNSRRSQCLQVFFILFSCFSSRKFEKTLVTCNV